MNRFTKYWFLEGFNLFSKLSKASMMQLSEIPEMENIEKGARIEFDKLNKNCVFFLKKGTVKIVDGSSGNVKCIVKRGNIFGELSLFEEGKTIKEVAYALEESIICFIVSDKMEELIEKHSSLKNGLIKIQGLRIKKLETRLSDLLYKDSSTRIKEFVFYYVREFGEENSDGTFTAKNLLSHKDISNLTNTSRQTVSNVMSNMRKDELIDYNSKHISTINNLKKASGGF
ncbi:Crp/Fnr family transcriptional regulator [Nonlabens sp. Asnod2-A12]|uniref:Crp/Fnr family transcriptional regulator n=1 Tax=Nonlabens sp. Asnod2-A12 TaxID=3160578 RepID=UPI003870AEE6